MFDINDCYSEINAMVDSGAVSLSDATIWDLFASYEYYQSAEYAALCG